MQSLTLIGREQEYEELEREKQKREEATMTPLEIKHNRRKKRKPFMPRSFGLMVNYMTYRDKRKQLEETIADVRRFMRR